MTARLKVKSVAIAYDFEAWNFMGNDGWPTSAVFSPLHVETEDGRNFILRMGERVQDGEGFTCYIPRYDAEKMKIKVEATGSININLWQEVFERESLEDSWGFEAAQREREDDMMGFNR